MITYLNQDMNPIYVCHFPGNSLDNNDFAKIAGSMAVESFTMTDQLSIVSVMDKGCWKNSLVKKQCQLSDIKLYNSAFDAVGWDNTMKINYILECLDEITTPYVLIVDGRDVTITHDLDDEFIEKVKKFNKPIVFNGTCAAYPSTPYPIESLKELIGAKGKHRFLNAGVCVGEKDALIDFYQKSAVVNEKEGKLNKSEQLVIRKTKHLYPELIAVDTNADIFRIMHFYDTSIRVIDANTVQIY